MIRTLMLKENDVYRCTGINISDANMLDNHFNLSSESNKVQEKDEPMAVNVCTPDVTHDITDDDNWEEKCRERYEHFAMQTKQEMEQQLNDIRLFQKLKWMSYKDQPENNLE